MALIINQHCSGTKKGSLNCIFKGRISTNEQGSSAPEVLPTYGSSLKSLVTLDLVVPVLFC